MSDPSLFSERATGAVAKNVLRSSESVVFVDVGAKRIDANVIRNGVPVGVHRIDTDLLADIIVDRPVLQLRVVGQSIAPGTPVPQGTSVTLTMAPPGRLPVGVIVGTHVALREIPMTEAFERFVAGKPQVNRIVARAVSGNLAPEDEAAVRELFASERVEIVDEPGRDVTAAVEALRTLTTFGR